MSTPKAHSTSHHRQPPAASRERDFLGPPESGQHLALFPSFICASSLSSPLVHIYASSAASGSPLGIVPPPPGWSSPARPDLVTAIVADQAVTPADGSHVPARLGIFYESGGFAIVRLRLAEDGRLVWVREALSTTRSRPRRRHAVPQRDDDPVVLAVMHYPVLVSCTVGFHLVVYKLADGSPTLVRTLRSDVSFHPAALSLLPPQNAGGTRYRAALTYSTPVYPSSWAVAEQELVINLAAGASVRRGECYHVQAAETSPTAWPRRIDPVPGVRGRAIGVGSDGRWVVLAGEDSVIHVYSLPAAGERAITHAQTLLAPSTGVSSLALVSGRAISGGRDGRVLVWELDEAADGEEGVGMEARVGRVGMAMGYVEVKAGGRRSRPREPSPPTEADEDQDDLALLPHPASISGEARRLFLASPPVSMAPASVAAPPKEQTGLGVRQVAFDEERIVGLEGDVMRVWSFS